MHIVEGMADMKLVQCALLVPDQFLIFRVPRQTSLADRQLPIFDVWSILQDCDQELDVMSVTVVFPTFT
jgi:hypothetical protein